jgi:MFS family permease
VRPEAAIPARASRASWAIWLSAAAVYLIAVFHRASFGVAGLEAADRFGVGSAALATFTVLQVGVYAAMQIPTGVLVDRFGSRTVLTAALVFLGLGQLLLALAHTYWLGLLARGVLGFGDALTFVSVLRLAANHFPARRYTLIAALTGSLGFLGNLAATVPLTLLLDGAGWTVTFATAAAATLAYMLVVRFAVRDTPSGHRGLVGASSPRAVGRQVAEAWRVPGTRLGFWTHFSTMFAPATLGLLWGMPFLVDAQGYSVTTASSLLTVFVIGALVGGPVVGAYIGRRPEMRMGLVIGYLSGALVVWTVLIAWPGQIPLAVLIAGFGFLSLGGPASGIAFALVRDYNPLHRVGTATGVVNVGGFTATTVALLGVGVLLEVTGGEYRIALLGLVGILLTGSWRMAVWFRRARAAVFQAEARGEDVPVQLRHRRWDAPIPAAA